MKVDILNQKQISVLLEDWDMREMNINLSKLDCDMKLAATVLWQVLSKAEEQANVKIQPQGEILIDIEPLENHTCKMTFTLSKSIQRNCGALKKGLVVPMIFQFSEVDHLLNAGKVLKNLNFSAVKSDLFSNGDNYRLIVYHPFKIYREIATLLQFSALIKGTLNVAVTKEHWNLITKTDALEKLAKA